MSSTKKISDSKGNHRPESPEKDPERFSISLILLLAWVVSLQNQLNENCFYTDIGVILNLLPPSHISLFTFIETTDNLNTDEFVC